VLVQAVLDSLPEAAHIIVMSNGGFAGMPRKISTAIQNMRALS
jgi:hypothetical protein